MLIELKCYFNNKGFFFFNWDFGLFNCCFYLFFVILMLNLVKLKNYIGVYLFYWDLFCFNIENNVYF